MLDHTDYNRPLDPYRDDLYGSMRESDEQMTDAMCQRVKAGKVGKPVDDAERQQERERIERLLWQVRQWLLDTGRDARKLTLKKLEMIYAAKFEGFAQCEEYQVKQDGND